MQQLRKYGERDDHLIEDYNEARNKRTEKFIVKIHCQIREKYF